jgi:hypothetical protein
MIEIFSMGPFRNVGTQARRLPNLPHSKFKDCNAVFQTCCGELKLSKASLTSASPTGWSIQEAGARAIKPGPEWQESRAGCKGRVAVATRFLMLRARVESLVIRRLIHVTTPSGELAEKELLGEACANPFSRANRKISEH